MRLAGQISDDVMQLIARVGEDESQWPSRHNPVPGETPLYRYDEHMKEHVPNLPLKRV